VGDPEPPGVAVAGGAGEAAGEEGVDGDAPPQAASASRSAASAAARRFIADILARGARMAVS
jgi:hypothetical protein